MFAVGKTQHGPLRTGHAFFNNHSGAGFAELFITHHGTDCRFRFHHRLGYDDAFAQGQTVRLNNNGRAHLAHIGKGFIHISENFIFGCGNAVLFHQIFGKGFAGLNDGGVFARTESGNARFGQSVHHTQGQGIIRGYHHIIHVVFFGKEHHGGDVCGLDLHAFGLGGDTAVAGRAPQFVQFGAFGQGVHNRVLPPAAAHDEYVHI